MLPFGSSLKKEPISAIIGYSMFETPACFDSTVYEKIYLKKFSKLSSLGKKARQKN